MNQYFIHDARKIKELPINSSIDLIITSPPYFDMKDYGSNNQIGFGQTYDKYLNDLELVFEQCYAVTKDTGSLWIIVDILRKEGEVKLLPLEVIQKVQQSGWKLQDIIIWKKDKTVPFTHNGQMRNISEYILFFSKTNKFKFYRERITSITDLKEWWQKYPERYSPNGKSPTNIWEFPIPLQGSWGNRYIKHFCPLPEGLIERIIHLSSDVNDTVFDPFAGSGAVLSAAYRLNRRYVGSDLNESYKDMFLNYIKKVKAIDTENIYDLNTQKKFSKTITKLRQLKFPKKLYVQLKKLHDELPILAIVAIPTVAKRDIPKHKFATCKYIVITKDNRKIPMEDIEKVVSKAPLSKFGVEAEIKALPLTSAIPYINRHINGAKIWRYDNGVTYQPGTPVEKITKAVISDLEYLKTPSIFSTVELKEEELTL
jgi:DNA modification methylase